MKLQTKFILVLLSAILLTLVGSQVFQQVLNTKALKHLGSENLGSLEQREKIHAENIFQTADPIVQQNISLGEMPKLDALIKNFTNIDGILEYSIYDKHGDAAFSSSQEVLKPRKTLPVDMKDQASSDPTKRSRQTSNAFEIYRPMVVTSKCIECHDDFKTGSIGGVAVLRLSTATLSSHLCSVDTPFQNLSSAVMRDEDFPEVPHQDYVRVYSRLHDGFTLEYRQGFYVIK